MSHLSPTGKLLTLQSVCITCRLLFSLSVISPSRVFLVDLMDFLSIIYQRKIELGLYKCCTSLFIYIFGIFSLLKSSINYEIFEKKFCWDYIKRIKNYIVKSILCQKYKKNNFFKNYYTMYKYYIYHGSYELLTYLNQRIRRRSWFE